MSHRLSLQIFRLNIVQSFHHILVLVLAYSGGYESVRLLLKKVILGTCNQCYVCEIWGFHSGEGSSW